MDSEMEKEFKEEMQAIFQEVQDRVIEALGEIAKIVTVKTDEEDVEEYEPDPVNWDEWLGTGNRSKATGLVIAPRDYIEGEKRLFTWDEAMKVAERAPKGWRLPTQAEWAHIIAEFGENKGRIEIEKVVERLNLGFNGWADRYGCISGQDVVGHIWLDTIHDSLFAHRFRFDVSDAYSFSSCGKKYLGHSVRLVFDSEEAK